MARQFEAGERVLILDSKRKRYLITLQAGGTFHFHRGSVPHDLVIGEEEGCTLRSTTGEPVIALRPTLSEFVLKMPRGAQVVYPKDLGTILILGDIFPGATVVEAGAGSGALTIALLRAIGKEGRLITFEVREDFAAKARENVEAFLGKTESLEIRMGSIYDGINESEVDRVILDLPEPWRAAAPAGEALRPGGIFLSYLPTVLQVHELVESLRKDPLWQDVSTSETLLRPWHIEGRSVRPEHRMVAHTGFITTARRIGLP